MLHMCMCVCMFFASLANDTDFHFHFGDEKILTINLLKLKYMV